MKHGCMLCYMGPLETYFYLLMILKSVSMGRKTECGTGEGGRGVCWGMLGGGQSTYILTVLSDTQQSLSIWARRPTLSTQDEDLCLLGGYYSGSKEMENINYTFIILLIHFFLITKARVDKRINYMSWYNLVFMILSLRLKLKCAIFLAIKLFWI